MKTREVNVVVLVKGHSQPVIPQSEDVPEDWLIWNAPRPLYGHKNWTGDFKHGCFYAAVDPEDEMAARYNLRNAELDGWLVDWVMEDEVYSAVLDRLEQLGLGDYDKDSIRQHSLREVWSTYQQTVKPFEFKFDEAGTGLL